MGYPTILLDEIKGAIDSALDDLYTDGVISAAIYNKKSTERFVVWAINSADRHVCLQTALSSIMNIYVPAGQKTVFLERQKEYLSNYLAEHDDVKLSDQSQYAYLVSDSRRLDIVSVLSNYANIYGDLPVEEGASPADVMYHALPQQVQNQTTRKYLGTTGNVYEEIPKGKTFYVEPNSRKIVLSEKTGSAIWMQFEAQVAPVGLKVTELNTTELDDYKIMCPYWAKDWLLFNALTRILPAPAASKYGYFDLETKAKAEAFQNKPGTGNVIIPGDDMDGNYEGNFSF